MALSTQSLTDAPPDGFSFVKESGGIEAYELEANGLQVLFMPERTAPVAAFMVTYHVGSRNEGPGLTGATHMLEHLMFKGTKRFNKRAGTSIFNTLQQVGARVNASTWLDRTNYYELLPVEHLPLAMEVEADRMRGALLDPQDVASERSVILNEFDRGENEPIRALYHALWATAFLAHPYRHPTIGWRSDIETITPDDLRGFYDTFYWPNNATVSIVGDVDRAAVLTEVQRHFGSIPASPDPIPEVTTQEPEQEGERRLELRRPGQAGVVLAGYKAPDASHQDSDALDVLASVLAMGNGSRLFRALVDKGLAAGVSAGAPRLRNPGLFYILALLAPEKDGPDIEAVLHEEIARLQDDGITPDELRRAVNQLKAQEAFGRDGPYSIVSQLNEAIAAGDWTLYTEYMDRIEAVTPADVQRVAQTYLRRAGRTVGHYIPS